MDWTFVEVIVLMLPRPGQVPVRVEVHRSPEKLGEGNNVRVLFNNRLWTFYWANAGDFSQAVEQVAKLVELFTERELREEEVETFEKVLKELAT